MQQNEAQDNEALKRKVAKKKEKPADLNSNTSCKKHGKVINPFDKKQKAQEPKTRNKIIETIGPNRFAELLNKFSGNGYDQKEVKANPEVKQYQKSTSINQKVESLFQSNTNESKPSVINEDIRKMRKKTLEDRAKEMNINEEQEEDDSDSDDLDLDDEKTEDVAKVTTTQSTNQTLNEEKDKDFKDNERDDIEEKPDL